MRPDILNPLFAEVEVLKGVGPQARQAAEALGLDRVVDLLFHLPVNWIDRKPVRPVDESDVGRIVIVEVTPRDYRQGGRAQPASRIFAEDAAGDYLTLVYFNNPAGRRSSCRSARRGSSRASSMPMATSWQIVHPEYVLVPGEAPACRREPVYPLTEGLTNKRMGDFAEQALERAPRACRMDRAEPARAAAGRAGPRRSRAAPSRSGADGEARERLAYDEVFANQLALMLLRASRAPQGRLPLAATGG